MTRSHFTLTAVIALAASAVAQTYTSCDPINVTCPADPALGTTFNETYNADSSLSTDYWNVTGTPAPSFPSDGTGMAFTITSEGEAPTMNTIFYVFGGHVEIIMQAAPGQGIISSIVLLSDDLDEIDIEIMGGNSSYVETNYFGKGNSSENNAIWYPASNPTVDSFHNYTINWNETQIDWFLDGNLIRSLPASEAVLPDGVTKFPQTPMQLKLGNWAGGASTNQPGTIEWAGGPTDFSKGPFTMMVQQLRVTDGTQNATQYTYGDKSGSWGSIDAATGTSKAASRINAVPAPSLVDRWDGYSKTKQIVIIACAAAAAVILFALVAWCCCCSCRAGRRRRHENQTVWNKEQVELLEYKKMMENGGFSGGPNTNTAYNHQPYGQQDYGNGYNHPDSLTDYDSGLHEKQGMYAQTARIS